MKGLLTCALTIFILNISAAQKQGVQGQLYWVTGNQMPAPDRSHVPQRGVMREIFVFEVATPSDVELEDGFFKKVHTKFVARAFSKPNGTFKIRLAPGTYSIFVKEDKGLYANIFDQENHISPVTVLPRKYSWITISINYSASY